ncbi:hypothetical protein GCM10027592_61070 [Spirosoma flavus]
MNTKHNLLIVDENPYVVDILAQNLRNEFTITVATTGQEAARLLIQGNRFDCVLTELNIPFFSGIELTKFIRTSRLLHHLPVVILSNAPDSSTRIECLEQGVDDFISKPFNPLEVKAKLNALLRRAVATEEGQKSPSSPQTAPVNKPLWQQRSRILSMLLGDYSLSQSA